MTTLESVWTDLMTELGERAPRTRAAIRPPRMDSDEVERALGLQLPDEIHNWFGLHDGAGWDFGDGQLIPIGFLRSIDDVIKATKMWREIMSEFETPEEFVAATRSR